MSDQISFLHRMDSVRGDTIVVETDRARLRQASFLDGRETFWSAERLVPLTVDLSDAPGPSRFIFHVGFCGSTLLSRLLDDPAGVLVLKEPQCLADIAGQRQLAIARQAQAPLPALIDHALARLNPTAGDGATVIKPTNWVNSLLPELCARERAVRAVFVSMDRRAYLGAVFRGGRARLEFCTRLAAEIAAVLPRGNALLQRAIASIDDPLDRAARIVVLLHAMQETLFDRAIAANGWTDEVRIDFSELATHPADALARARTALALEPVADDHVRVAGVMQRHTKDPATEYSPSQRAREDHEVDRLHRHRFDAALAWLEQTGADFG